MGYDGSLFSNNFVVFLMFGVDLLDFESELAENGMELMAKDMRTQPTSQNSTPTSQNFDFVTFRCCMFYVCHVF